MTRCVVHGRISNTVGQDKLLRALAETQNVRQRGQRELDSMRQFAVQSFAKQLLEVADLLEMAITSQPPDPAGDANAPSSPSSQQQQQRIMEGVSLTHRRLIKILADNGITEISAVGEKFDPNKHEALFEIDMPDKEAGTVGVVSKKGYMLHSRVLRAASVGVVRRRNPQ